jgi:adhesin transport system outer membrane protein
MNKIYSFVLKVTVVVLVSTSALADTYANVPGENALRQAIEKAVAENPEVQVRYHTFRAAEQEQKVARGALMPRADINTTFRKQEQIGPNIGAAQIPERLTQLVVRQLLFDGFATSGEVNRLGHASKVRYYELLSTMQNTALEVARAYIDILRFRELTSYAQDNYIAHKQLFDRIQERVGSGVGRKVDLEQASGRLALAEANLLTETTNLHDVTARYQRLVGELPPDNLPDIDFYKQGVPDSVNQSLEIAYKQNPDLLSTIENIVATDQEVKNKRAKYFPRLDLQGRKNLGVSSDGANSVAAADVLELTLSFNLFNGMADRSAVNQTVEKLNSAQDLRDKACVDTRQLIVIAYNDIVRLKEQLIYRDQHQLAIEKAREAYRKQFDIGQRTLLDLLDTENEFFQARRTYTVTERDLHTAFARTYAGQGELLSRLGVARADLPEFTREEYFDRENICRVEAPKLLQIDKQGIVAKAKPLSATLTSLDKPVQQQVPVSAPKASETEAIASRVSQWVEAWQKKDYAGYITYYAETFTPEKPLTRSAWLNQRKQRLATPEDIKITLKDININLDGNKALVDFSQVYSTSTYSDTTKKKLLLEKINDVWLIIKETSSKK